MKQCTEQQFLIQELRKGEIEFFLSETYIDWDYIIGLIESTKNIVDKFPDDGEVRDISEWYDKSKYREGFTNDEFSDWLKIKTMKDVFEIVKESK